MTKIIYFMGDCKRCEVVSNVSNIPASSRYVTTSEGYDIYDTQEFEERYVAIIANKVNI